MNKREFLKGITLLGSSFILPNITFANDIVKDKKFIYIFLRGGMDGLTLLNPYAIDEYYKYRPNIAIPKKKTIKINDKFGLHPVFEKSLLKFYEDNNLIFIPRAGQENNSRSHFQAQDAMEYGNNQIKSNDGFLNRLVQTMHLQNSMSFTSGLPEIFKGKVRINNIFLPTYYSNINQYNKKELSMNLSRINPSIEDNYQNILKNNLFFETLEKKYTNFKSRTNGEKIGIFIRETNTNISFIDTGHNWDTHTLYEPTHGKLFNLFSMLNETLVDLKKGLGSEWNNTTIVINTEFGRGIKENGAQGTEHGKGGLMMVTGGHVKQSRILGDINNLKLEDAFEERDLHVEFDYREVIASIFKNHFNIPKDKIDFVLPGLTHQLNIS